MAIAPSASAVVVTATVGKPTLKRTLDAVLRQTWADTLALVVVDGPEYRDRSRRVVEKYSGESRVQVLELPQNTGANGYVCHRIYGAVPHLVNQDFILYCDDDNWYEPSHVESCVTACVANNLSWCCTLRNIFKDDAFLCRDECESLGMWPVWYNPGIFHVDTNCYCLRRDVATRIASLWHRSRVVDGIVQPSADTEVCNHLKRHYPAHALVARHSVNYELGSWALSPTPEFFSRGNAEFLRQHDGVLPWHRARVDDSA